MIAEDALVYCVERDQGSKHQQTPLILYRTPRPSSGKEESVDELLRIVVLLFRLAISASDSIRQQLGNQIQKLKNSPPRYENTSRRVAVTNMVITSIYSTPSESFEAQTASSLMYREARFYSRHHR